jgi:hemerythrin
MLEQIKRQVGGWLINHVRAEDIKMAAFLTSAGAPSSG